MPAHRALHYRSSVDPGECLLHFTSKAPAEPGLFVITNPSLPTPWPVSAPGQGASHPPFLRPLPSVSSRVSSLLAASDKVIKTNSKQGPGVRGDSLAKKMARMALQ